MKKVLFSTLLISAFLITACGSTAPTTDTSPAPVAGDDTIKIGYIGPLTGDIASIGQDEKAVVEMFFAENPTIAGKKVDVVYEDAQCNGEKAASAAQKLVSVDKVQAIVGGACSGETLGAAPVAEKGKVVLFSSTSTSPKITDAGDYVFRNAPSDDKSSDVMVDAVGKKYKKVAMISQNNDYGQAYRAALDEKFPKAGVKIVVDETFNSGTTDFKTILQKVKNSDAEVLIMLPGEGSPGGFMVKQAKELGLKLPLYGGDGLTAQEFFDIGKDATEGAITVIAVADKTRADVKAFLDKFHQKTGHDSSSEVYIVLTWDRLNILKNAIESVGYDGTKIKEYFYNMPVYKGLAGDEQFDKNGDSGLLPSLMVAKGGKFELLK